MINISSFYNHTLELDIEGFRAKTKRAKLYGEMNYVTYQNSKVSKFARRYTTIPIYHASALNLFHRGVDGLSLFNYDYVPDKQRLPMTEGLKRITDIEFLKSQSKDYVVYSGFGTFPANNEKARGDHPRRHGQGEVLPRRAAHRDAEELRGAANLRPTQRQAAGTGRARRHGTLPGSRQERGLSNP
jgi:hypothetical protein